MMKVLVASLHTAQYCSTSYWLNIAFVDCSIQSNRTLRLLYYCWHSCRLCETFPMPYPSGCNWLELIYQPLLFSTSWTSKSSQLANKRFSIGSLYMWINCICPEGHIISGYTLIHKKTSLGFQQSAGETSRLEVLYYYYAQWNAAG